MFIKNLTSADWSVIDDALYHLLYDMRKELDAWLELANEVNSDGTIKYPNAPKNVKFLQSKVEQIENVRSKL